MILKRMYIKMRLRKSLIYYRSSEQRFIGVIRKTKDESNVIHTRVENTNDKVSLINQNIMEISAAMEETGANIDSQTTSIQNIDKTCKDTTHAVDVLVSHAEEMSDKAKEIGERVNEAVQKLMTDKDSAVVKARRKQKSYANGDSADKNYWRDCNCLSVN